MYPTQFYGNQYEKKFLILVKIQSYIVPRKILSNINSKRINLLYFVLGIVVVFYVTFGIDKWFLP